MEIRIIKVISIFWLVSLAYYSLLAIPKGGGTATFYAIVLVAYCVHMLLLLKNVKFSLFLSFVPPVLVMLFFGGFVVSSIGANLGYDMYHDAPSMKYTLVTGGLTVLPAIAMLVLLVRVFVLKHKQSNKSFKKDAKQHRAF
jgi:hypothetical protein